MDNYLKYIKPSVRSLAAYHLSEHEYQVKLNQNESPYDLPLWLKEDILREFKSLAWNRYPSYTNSRLNEELSSYLELSPDRVLVGNGSNELLQILFSVVGSSGEKILLVIPTFQIYRQLGVVAEVETLQIEFAEDWSFPVGKIAKVLHEENISLCILCTPNSPTGTTLSPDDLGYILDSAKGLVVVDEAYGEFASTDYLSLQKSYRNLIITRTFSKAMGLAGLRIGYLIAEPSLIREINKGKLPYNLNILSELTATRLLENSSLITDNVKQILEEKRRLIEQLSNLKNVTVFPSEANFFMIKTPLLGLALFGRLNEAGILVRDISHYHPRLENFVRITVGTSQENAILVKALKHVFR